MTDGFDADELRDAVIDVDDVIPHIKVEKRVGDLRPACDPSDPTAYVVAME